MSSGKFKKDYDLPSLLSVREQRTDRVPSLKVSRPLQESFWKAVDYCMYRLKNKSQRNYSHFAFKVAILVMKLRSQLKKDGFRRDGSDVSSGLSEEIPQYMC